MGTTTDTIGVIGLGYVGLPLAVEFGKTIKTIGFDINHYRVEELKSGTDSTLEVTGEELSSAANLTFTDKLICARLSQPSPL